MINLGCFASVVGRIAFVTALVAAVVGIVAAVAVVGIVGTRFVITMQAYWMIPIAPTFQAMVVSSCGAVKPCKVANCSTYHSSCS